ncbi:uncharacterized protein LOC103310448 [Acyrthosiphon pisum]|uniref:Mutator-like transposase domain-containing protein n=1 Tax=Acyrthosiphon pisum TaxID=7029 RepID=A0A8R2JMY4_ACYPI|nr:uncharacterized protein LOC103310448 [Acyrthosiphon pisum]
MAYIFLQIQNSCSKMHTPGFGCTFINVEFMKEIRKGFESTWIFKCKMCNLLTTILSETKKLEYIPINKAITNGTCAIGIGYTQLAELSASIDIPCMSPNTYIKLTDILSEDIKVTAWNVMKLAGIEEKQLALEAGDVDIDGIPMCPVVADGQWSKRSYKTKYDAYSGAATIIGYRTKKVLFVGIRNRYCAICERAKIVKLDPKPHKCFLNWTKGATSMEADGIAEGFLNSIELHGLKFNKLIGDGDSSVTKRLNEVMPYGPTFLVEKIECRNHILRNYSQKLMNLTRITKYPCFIRKFIVRNIIRFRTAITKSIKYRKNLDESNYQKIEGLRKDILNSPYHIFGKHTNCAQYFCTGRKLYELNLIDEVLQCGLMKDIYTALRRVADNAKSLLLDVDNNICEQFNSVINKHIGGKRINFSQKQSYSTRIYTAVVSFNTNGNYIREIHKKITTKSPGIVAKKFLKHAADKRITLRRRRALFKLSGVYKSKKISCGPDEHYGLAEPLDDFLSEEEMKNKKAEFIKSLSLSLTAKKTLDF